jgi:hypothetical protein
MGYVHICSPMYVTNIGQDQSETDKTRAKMKYNYNNAVVRGRTSVSRSSYEG